MSTSLSDGDGPSRLAAGGRDAGKSGSSGLLIGPGAAVGHSTACDHVEALISSNEARFQFATKATDCSTL
jgi:hypothetical protein